MRYCGCPRLLGHCRQPATATCSRSSLVLHTDMGLRVLACGTTRRKGGKASPQRPMGRNWSERLCDSPADVRASPKAPRAGVKQARPLLRRRRGRLAHLPVLGKRGSPWPSANWQPIAPLLCRLATFGLGITWFGGSVVTDRGH